jgi:hypothetical protein
MSTATITNSVEEAGKLQNNYSIPTLISRNVIIKPGCLTFDGGDYATGGISWEPEGMDYLKVMCVLFETDVAGWQFHWVQSTKMLTVWNGTTQHSAAAISITTKYLAIGAK